MKKIFIYLFIFSLYSCSSNKCIEVYLNSEKKLNKENYKLILFDRKIEVSKIIKIYKGFKKLNLNTQAKSFNQKDYEYLKNKYEKDTLIKYWNKKDILKLSFDSLIKYQDYYKSYDSINETKLVYLYFLSKPIYFKNKNTSLFRIRKFNKYRNPEEDCIIIMKKKYGKWVFVEKVYNTDLN